MVVNQPRLGPSLRRAWVGYQRRIDDAMTAAGFGDRGFPDGRVLRMCRDDPDITSAAIARELGMSRQGAGKIVNALRDRGFVTLAPSEQSGREKKITLTPRAHDYLAAQRQAARAVEHQLRRRVGAEGFDALARLVDELGADDPPRLREYLRQKSVREL